MSMEQEEIAVLREKHASHGRQQERGEPRI
jgi:hypothetical protein